MMAQKGDLYIEMFRTLSGVRLMLKFVAVKYSLYRCNEIILCQK